MAEALFRSTSEKYALGLHISSAGVAATVGRPPPHMVIALMKKHGLDVSNYQAKQLDATLASQQDLILVMEASHQKFIRQNWIHLTGRVRLLGEWRNAEISDPFGGDDAFYSECLAHIASCVDDWKARLQ